MVREKSLQKNITPMLEYSYTMRYPQIMLKNDYLYIIPKNIRRQPEAHERDMTQALANHFRKNVVFNSASKIIRGLNRYF